MQPNVYNRSRPERVNPKVRNQNMETTVNTLPTAAAEAVSFTERQEPAGIPELKTRLAALRVNEAEIESFLAPKEKELDQAIAEVQARHDAQNRELLDLAQQVRDEREKAEADLRTALVDHFKATGQKTFDKDLGVRVSEKLEYADEEALVWATMNAPFMVVRSVDKKAFENVAKLQKLVFVTITPTVTATVAKQFGGREGDR